MITPPPTPPSPIPPSPITPPEIVTTRLRTPRTTTLVRSLADRDHAGEDHAEPVVLLHGNVTSSAFFEPLMRGLPGRFAPLAPDLRGFGGSDPAPVDATRGMRDFADDILATLDALGLDSVHLAGWSLGGAVAMRLAIDDPQRIRSLTLIAPMSPLGFGGIWSAAGNLAPDATLVGDGSVGSGAGMTSRTFVRLLHDQGAAASGPASLQSMLDHMFTAAGWDGERRDDYLASMATTVVGDDHFPGDITPTDAWPGFAAGTRGVLNAMSPRYVDLTDLAVIEPKPPILWVRGSADVAISDAPMMDAVQRSIAGSLPPCPDRERWAPQPMLAQTRDLLQRYAMGGGMVRDVVIPGCGHAPHIEDVPRTLEAIVPHLDGSLLP